MIEGTPINEMIKDFLESTDLAQSTRQLYKKNLSYFVLFLIKVKGSVNDIKFKDILDYRNHLRALALSPATIDNYLASIRSFFAWLAKYKFIESNIVRDLKKEQNAHRVIIKQCLTMNQVNDLIESIKDDSVILKRDKAIIQLQVFTGLRCIEVQRLSCGDFRQTPDGWFLQIHRKGRREAGEVMPVTDDIVKAIEDYLHTREDPIEEQTPMFVSHGPHNKHGRLQTTFISQMIKARLRSIGLDGSKYSAHSLRHTAASLAHLAGAEVWEIQSMLGHTTASQTERYLKSLGRSIGSDGAAIWKLDRYAKEYREKNKKQGNNREQ